MSRYRLQLQEWEVAKLDATIAHATHRELGSSQETLDRLSARVVEANKAIHILEKAIEALPQLEAIER